jgi:hypothetical protein
MIPEGFRFGEWLNFNEAVKFLYIEPLSIAGQNKGYCRFIKWSANCWLKKPMSISLG